MQQPQLELQQQPTLLIFVSTCPANLVRRRALRSTWFRYVHDASSPVPPGLRSAVQITFVASRGYAELEQEAAREGDIVLVDAPEGYEHLWRKALVFLEHTRAARQAAGAPPPDFVMHADDDSFLRLDLLLPLLASWPRTRHYWGYIWDGTSNRTTAPIRNPSNKSHMPESQYAPDFYPPFASGCGFALSWDLVEALLAQPLPDYRLLDPPFGIHLCGGPGFSVLGEAGPVVPTHDERVRPYRPLPTFRADTLVQHYLRPEEMKPFYLQALESAAAAASSSTRCGDDNSSCSAGGPGGGAAARHAGQPGGAGAALGASGAQQACSGAAGIVAKVAGGGVAPLGKAAPEQLYDTLVQLGLLRR